MDPIKVENIRSYSLNLCYKIQTITGEGTRLFNTFIRSMPPFQIFFFKFSLTPILKIFIRDEKHGSKYFAARFALNSQNLEVGLTCNFKMADHEQGL